MPFDLLKAALIGGGIPFLAGLIYMAVGQHHSVPDEYWIDKFWGDGSIDDDDWGLAIANARQTGNQRRSGLAERRAQSDGQEEG
jgi:hypothetical protein